MLRRVVHLLENAGNREQEAGFERLQRRDELLGVGLMTHPGTRRNAEHGDEPRENVGDGNEEQRGCLRINHFTECDQGVASQFDEIGMGENTTLGLAGRTGRVDERRNIFTLRNTAPAFDFCVINVLSLGA